MTLFLFYNFFHTHLCISIRYKIYRGVYEKNYKIKKESYLDGKTVFTYVSGLYSGYF